MEATIEGMTLEEKLGQLFLPMAVEAPEDVLAKYDRMGLRPERPRVCRGLTAAANAMKENLSRTFCAGEVWLLLEESFISAIFPIWVLQCVSAEEALSPQDKYNKTDTKFIEKFSFS